MQRKNTSRFLRRLTLSALIAAPLALSSCVAIAIGAGGGAAAGAVTSSKQPGYSAGTYIGTVLANAIYVPVKIVYAGLGAAASGVAYVASGGNRMTSGKVWEATVEGDYVLTPAMIAGKEKVDFVGP